MVTARSPLISIWSATPPVWSLDRVIPHPSLFDAGADSRRRRRVGQNRTRDQRRHRPERARRTRPVDGSICPGGPSSSPAGTVESASVMAEGIAQAGGSVSVWGRNADKNAAAADALARIAAANGSGASFTAHVCDVSDEAQVCDVDGADRCRARSPRWPVRERGPRRHRDALPRNVARRVARRDGRQPRRGLPHLARGGEGDGRAGHRRQPRRSVVDVGGPRRRRQRGVRHREDRA